jgi:hypothetical protein
VVLVTVIDGVDSTSSTEMTMKITMAAVMPAQMLMGASMRIPALANNADTSQIQKFGQSFSA